MGGTDITVILALLEHRTSCAQNADRNGTGRAASRPKQRAASAGIQETVLLYQGNKGRPRARRMLTETTPTQHALYNLFNLDNYAPTR